MGGRLSRGFGTGTRRAVAAGLACLAGCVGTIDAGPAGPGREAGEEPEGGGPADAVSGPLSEASGFGPTGIRRLTRGEYRNTVRDLLGVDPGADVELLPEDALTPFDNDYTTQLTSSALIEALKAIAERTTKKALADPAMRDRLVGCTPSGPGDRECLREFIARFGRRALRRPLREEEIDQFAAFQRVAEEQEDFYIAVSMVVRALLQDLEFVYRIEDGEPVQGREGVYRLDDWEIATRLSYLLWGSTPDPRLLDRAAAGRLQTAEQIRRAARRMLEDPKATERLQRFHAMWLGYARLPHSADVSRAMRRESDALVERIVFEQQRSWLDLFTAERTFIGSLLAENYGLEPPAGGEPRWVDYGDSGRGGILSHGSFLSNGAKFGDTSPTLRGIVVRERLLCQDIPSPPPDVNTDEPPQEVSEDACKLERYEAHAQGGCASCHSKIDPIGFGLERYDETGSYRTHEDGRPECGLPGEGKVDGLGSFNGPAELGSLLVDSGQLGSCLSKQLFRFVVGREGRTRDRDAIEALAEEFRNDDHRLRELVLDLVSSKAFRYRVVDAGDTEG